MMACLQRDEVACVRRGFARRERRERYDGFLLAVGLAPSRWTGLLGLMDRIHRLDIRKHILAGYP